MLRRLAVLGLPVVLLSLLLAMPLLALGAPAPDAAPNGPVAGVPDRALAAYRGAVTAAGCPGLRWELLAGIGFVESHHGGAGLDPVTGEVKPWIFGPLLDGTHATVALPIRTWNGWWGLTGAWQRAVGPMQFLPATFSAWATDADGDGVANPHDLDDAAATAARLLCGSAGHIDDERTVLLRYNHSASYADTVLRYAEGLSSAMTATMLCPVEGPVSFTHTWLAPRPGGRRHLGVDMFATTGTPVVAPADGRVEAEDNDLGGLAFGLWGNDGTYYYGAHLAAHGATPGPVRAGTVIGYVGQTGDARTTAPHLHFEIHPGRRPGDGPRPVNPTPAVAAACADRRLGVAFSATDG